MNEKIKEALLKMADMAKTEQDDARALKFSQSALNLAHAGSILYGVGHQIELLELQKQQEKKIGVGAK